MWNFNQLCMFSAFHSINYNFIFIFISPFFVGDIFNFFSSTLKKNNEIMCQTYIFVGISLYTLSKSFVYKFYSSSLYVHWFRGNDYIIVLFSAIVNSSIVLCVQPVEENYANPNTCFFHVLFKVHFI